MATTPPKGKGKKKGRGRVYLALGLVAALVLGYVLYRRGSGASSVIPASGNNAGAAQPSDSGSAGGLSGSPSPDTSGSDLLNTLAAENGSLLNSLLGTRIGPASFGAPPAQATQPTAPAPTLAGAQPAPLAASDFSVSPYQGASIPVTGVSQATPGFDQYPVLDLSNVNAPPALSYNDISAQPVPVEKQATTPGGYPTLDLSHVSTAPPATAKPTAVAVSANKTGATKQGSRGIISIH